MVYDVGAGDGVTDEPYQEERLPYLKDIIKAAVFLRTNQ